MTTIPNLNPLPAVTGDDYLITHDITTNRSGRVSAAALKAYTNTNITSDEISYSFSNVEDQLDKSTRIIADFATLSSTEGFFGDKIYLLGHTVAGLGGGTFVAKSATGLTADGGTIAIFGALAWVREITNNVVTASMFGALSLFTYPAHDSTTAIQSAVNNYDCVYIDDYYGITSAIKLNREKMSLKGIGLPFGPGATAIKKGNAGLKALPTFASETIGGATAKAMIWYQAPGLATDDTWVEGGEISGLMLYTGNQEIEGIRINRVTSGQSFRNLRIVQPSIGIYGTKWGWITHFDNVYVNEALYSSVRLSNGYNGCTFTNCFLYGGNVETEVHLDIALDSYGNSFNGGAIEGCKISVRTLNSQISFYGTDFEVCSDKFFEIKGIFSGSSLDFANPICEVTGCTFVGLTSIAGVEVTGGSAAVHGNFFYNVSGGLPGAGVYALNGVSGGDAISGFEQPCISEYDNTFRGWGTNYSTGAVFSRFTSIASGTSSFSKIKVGQTSSRMVETTPYELYVLGKGRTPNLFNYALPAFGSNTHILKLTGLGDAATLNAGVDTAIATQYDKESASLTFYSNDQGGSPQTCYGKSTLSAFVTQLNTKVSERSVSVDTIAGGVIPGSDNSHKLGSAAARWQEVFCANPAINTSDGRLKTEVSEVTEQERLVAVSLKGLLRSFKYTQSVQEDPEGARIHFGVIAQEVRDCFISHGLDPEMYSLFCKDEWWVMDGEVFYPGQVKPAEAEYRYLYGIRYDELLCFIVACL